MVEEFVERTKWGSYEYAVKCPKCGKRLATIYYSSGYFAYQFFVDSDCQHYRWEWVGNGCFPIQLDPEICEGVQELAEKAIAIYEDGTTVYMLIPR